MRLSRVFFAVMSMVTGFGTGAFAQEATAPTGAAPAWFASLTPEQRMSFEDANKLFNASDFADALPKLRTLHDELPQNETIAKFAAEAAVNTGDYGLAASLLEPILRANPDDPQALGIEAHLYGQQDDAAKRDAVMDHIQKLYDGGKPSPRVVLIEKDSLPTGGYVRIYDYVAPQSRFHIVLMAEFYDGAGHRIKRTTLESDDFDQPSFAKAHPEQAAAGVRMYSMDSYTETRNPQGQITGQTHATLCPVAGCFMAGRPTYELFRSTVLGTNKAAPISSSTTPVKPSE